MSSFTSLTCLGAGPLSLERRRKFGGGPRQEGSLGQRARPLETQTLGRVGAGKGSGEACEACAAFSVGGGTGKPDMVEVEVRNPVSDRDCLFKNIFISLMSEFSPKAKKRAPLLCQINPNRHL